MSFPAVSGRRRRSRDWLHMDDIIAASDDAPADFRRVTVTTPVLVDGEIYMVDYDTLMPNRDREYDLDRLYARWREPADPDLAFYGWRKRARAPASSDDAIQGLLREARAGDAGMPDECAVCLQDFDANAKETLRVMPSCSHAFHPDCIFSWLRVKALCPLCRQALPTQQQQQQQDQDFEDEDDTGGVNYQHESTPAVPDPEES